MLLGRAPNCKLLLMGSNVLLLLFFGSHVVSVIVDKNTRVDGSDPTRIDGVFAAKKQTRKSTESSRKLEEVGAPFSDAAKLKDGSVKADAISVKADGVSMRDQDATIEEDGAPKPLKESSTLSSLLDNIYDWFHIIYITMPVSVRITLQIFVFLYSFGGLAFSADHMCNSMETLCDHWGIPEDVGGASFMAFGSAIPEITVNAISTYKSVIAAQTDIQKKKDELKRNRSNRDVKKSRHNLDTELQGSVEKMKETSKAICETKKEDNHPLKSDVKAEIVIEQSAATSSTSNAEPVSPKVNPTQTSRESFHPEDPVVETESSRILREKQRVSADGGSASSYDLPSSSSFVSIFFDSGEIPQQSFWEVHRYPSSSSTSLPKDSILLEGKGGSVVTINDGITGLVSDEGTSSSSPPSRHTTVSYPAWHTSPAFHPGHNRLRRLGDGRLLNRMNDNGQASPADLGIGGILGSGLIAFLMIPAVCIMFSPRNDLTGKRGLILKREILQRDVLFYVSALLVLVAALEHRSGDLIFSLALLVIYVVYIGSLVRARRQHMRMASADSARASSSFRERYISQSPLMSPRDELSQPLQEHGGNHDGSGFTGGSGIRQVADLALVSITHSGSRHNMSDDRYALMEDMNNGGWATHGDLNSSDKSSRGLQLRDIRGVVPADGPYDVSYKPVDANLRSSDPASTMNDSNSESRFSGSSLSSDRPSDRLASGRNTLLTGRRPTGSLAEGDQGDDPNASSRMAMWSVPLVAMPASIQDRFIMGYGCILYFLDKVFKPLHFMLESTCPDCRILQRRENWYPITFLVSFGWISFFSYFVTEIATDWVDSIQMPSLMAFFGIVLVAIGAEIPDGVNSVTCAQRGYGSMSTAACLGSQIANICLGLGLSWTIANLLGPRTEEFQLLSMDGIIDFPNGVIEQGEGGSMGTDARRIADSTVDHHDPTSNHRNFTPDQLHIPHDYSGLNFSLLGSTIAIGKHDRLIHIASYCQLVNVCIFFLITIGLARYKGKESVVLGKSHMLLFLTLYAVFVSLFCIVALSKKDDDRQV